MNNVVGPDHEMPMGPRDRNMGVMLHRETCTDKNEPRARVPDVVKGGQCIAGRWIVGHLGQPMEHPISAPLHI